MKAKVLTNEQMYLRISRITRTKTFVIGDNFYPFLKAVRIAKKLGLETVQTTNGDELIVERAIQFLSILAKKRIEYVKIPHDRSRTEWLKCSYCEEWHEPDFITQDYAGESICEDCLDNYNTCENCGEYVHCDDATWTESSCNNDAMAFCPNCADSYTFRCDNCGDTHHVDERFAVNGGYDSVCEDCINNDYFYCEGCDEYYHNDESNYSESDGCCYCDSCYEDRIPSSGVHNYGYKPDPVFFGESSYYFGIEIECEPKNIETCELAEDVEPVMYLKEDGSLNYDGVEIVSHPMSFDYIHKEMDWNFLDNVKGWINNYGIHIHICRKAFKNQFHIEKVINFFAKEPDFINAIAQRNSDRWAKIQKKKGIGNKRGRYNAINQMCSNTIEFRIFQTSCRKDRVLKNIQFVDAVVNYCRKPILINEMSKKSFELYVSENKDKYPELLAYIATINDGTARMKR